MEILPKPFLETSPLGFGAGAGGGEGRRSRRRGRPARPDGDARRCGLAGPGTPLSRRMRGQMSPTALERAVSEILGLLFVPRCRFSYNNDISAATQRFLLPVQVRGSGRPGRGGAGEHRPRGSPARPAGGGGRTCRTPGSRPARRQERAQTCSTGQGRTPREDPGRPGNPGSDGGGPLVAGAGPGPGPGPGPGLGPLVGPSAHAPAAPPIARSYWAPGRRPA